LNSLFEHEVEISRIRHGKKQTLDTLITEEAMLLAQYLRNEKQAWIPRIATLSKNSRNGDISQIPPFSFLRVCVQLVTLFGIKLGLADAQSFIFLNLSGRLRGKIIVN
jgi:hypothetical protein